MAQDNERGTLKSHGPAPALPRHAISSKLLVAAESSGSRSRLRRKSPICFSETTASFNNTERYRLTPDETYNLWLLNRKLVCRTSVGIVECSADCRPTHSALQLSAHQVHSPLLNHISLADYRNLHTKSTLCPMGVRNNGSSSISTTRQGCLLGGAQRNVTQSHLERAFRLRLSCLRGIAQLAGSAWPEVSRHGSAAPLLSLLG
jgi:hypothetical protein